MFGVFIANVEHLTSKKVIVYASLLSIVLFSCALYFTVTSFTMLSYTLATHLFGLGVIFSYLLFKKKIAILAFFGGVSYEIYLFEGALMNIQFSTILTVNAIIFIYITTAVALLFNKLHSKF